MNMKRLQRDEKVRANSGRKPQQIANRNSWNNSQRNNQPLQQSTTNDADNRLERASDKSSNASSSTSSTNEKCQPPHNRFTVLAQDVGGTDTSDEEVEVKDVDDAGELKAGTIVGVYNWTLESYVEIEDVGDRENSLSSSSGSSISSADEGSVLDPALSPADVDTYTICTILEELRSYFQNRYYLFTRYDKGVWLTDRSWFEVTWERIARYIISPPPHWLEMRSLTYKKEIAMPKRELGARGGSGNI